MMNPSTSNPIETKQQIFERVLSSRPFAGLKAILESLCSDHEALLAGVLVTSSYGELVQRLGYRLVFTKQIHEQDAHTRTGRAGGIRAVLPYYDTTTQSSLPTLVNYNSTVTTTPPSADYFDKMLASLKSQVSA